MSELNKLNNKYAYLHQLTLEELLELLAVAPIPAASPEKQAYVDALKEAIIENQSSAEFFPDIDQQWEQFVTYYLPEIDETVLEPEHIECNGLTQINQQTLEAPPERKVRFNRLRHAAVVAAAAIACMLAVIVTAQAAGIDVFGAIARWTKDVFSFGQISPDSVVTDSFDRSVGENKIGMPAPEQKFSSLQEALDAYGMTEVHEPHWLPEGYTMSEVDTMHSNDPPTETYYVAYAYKDNYIQIDIIRCIGVPTMQVEKTDTFVETIEQNGITFYLIENTNSYTITWCTEEYEYYISGKLGKDVLWEIAASMLQ